MTTIEEARRVILDRVARLEPEEVPLLEALGRVAARDVCAPWDIPAADNSAMDGYAFRASAARDGLLRTNGFLPAGATPRGEVAAGEAVRIMTGAPLPPGCDTVVPIEEVEVIPGGIRLKTAPKARAHVRDRGEDVREGDLVIPAGTVLRPAEIGMLAAFGRTTAVVPRRPRAAILSTGDEILEAGSPPHPGKVFDSNGQSLAALVLEAGGEPQLLGIARDDPGDTREKVAQGLSADLLIATGGVSVGDRDFVKESISALGGEILFWKVSMKPGKPAAFAVLAGRPVFALPGNPAAAVVAFEQLVRPAIRKMAWHSRLFRPVVRATLAEPLRNAGDRPHLVRGVVDLAAGRYRVASTGNQSSARLSSVIRSNGLILLPPGAAPAAGDEVDVQILDREFESGEYPVVEGTT